MSSLTDDYLKWLFEQKHKACNICFHAYENGHKAANTFVQPFVKSRDLDEFYKIYPNEDISARYLTWCTYRKGQGTPCEYCQLTYRVGFESVISAFLNVLTAMKHFESLVPLRYLYGEKKDK